MITNPDNLSKDRLKAELKKRGIKFNSNENKSYYVDLYRSKVMGPGQQKVGRGEFSSDDEIRQSPKVYKKPATPAKRKGKADPIMTDIKGMSDDELRSKLQELLGQAPGPVTNITRSTLQRQLARLMEEEKEYSKVTSSKKHAVKEVVEEDSYIAEWSDDDEEQEEAADEGIAEADSEACDVTCYNLRSRQPQQQKPGSKRRPSPPRSSTPPWKAAPGKPRGAGKSVSSAESCRILWSLFLLVATFMVVFLLYEHFTVPDGKTSLIVSGYVYVRETLYLPLSMARQEVEQPEGDTTSPPPPPPAEESPQSTKAPPEVKKPKAAPKKETPPKKEKETKPKTSSSDKNKSK